MSKWQERALLILILLAAAALRLTGLNWDNYDHHHPDERYITWVATTIEWPSDWKTALDPSQSSFNPYYWSPDADSDGIEVPQDEQRKFAYGHFPLYLGVAATRLMERIGPALSGRMPAHWSFTRDVLNGGELIEYRHLTAVTRALTALTDVAAVWMLFLLGRQAYGPAVGLLAASFLALNVMHIQLAHFFAFDPYMTTFTVAAVYFMILAVEEDRQAAVKTNHQSSVRRATRYLFAAAIFVGLAVGSKFAAVLLGFPLAVATALSPVKRQGVMLALLVGIATIVFAVTNPFAILDQTCDVFTPAIKLGPLSVPALDWGSCFLANVSTQGAMVRGDLDLAFVRQYAGTLPYFYYLEMQLRWGMGWLLGLLALAGFGWFLLRLLSRLELNSWRGELEHLLRHVQPASIVLLTWVGPFILVTGSFFVKFMRYLQPVTPFFMLFGAAMIWGWRNNLGKWLVAPLVMVGTGLYALSFVNIYDQLHPWTAASSWIYSHVAPDALILSEQWDDALPVSLVIDGEYRRRSEYRNEELTWLTRTGERDDEAKLKVNLELLAKADYLTIVSNRVYGVVPRLPQRYPISSQYHQLLFDGSLGYRVASIHGRFPHLFGFHLKPDTFQWPGLRPPPEVSDYLGRFPGLNGGRTDESFTVYDQPLTIIFENVGDQTVEEMLHSFELE